MYSSVFNCEQVAASKKNTGSEVLGNPYHKIQKIHVAFNWQFSEFCASMWQEFTRQHEPLVFFKDLFGQRQDTELWNNQFPETKKLGQRMRALV